MKKVDEDNKVLNVEDCVRLLAKRRNIPLTDADELFSDCMLVLAEAIIQGGVSIRHLFTIRKTLRTGRKGVLRDKEFTSKDLYTLHIRAGKKLSDAMNS